MYNEGYETMSNSKAKYEGAIIMGDITPMVRHAAEVFNKASRKQRSFSIDLPAYWSSALINNDYSGIDDALLEVTAWQRDNPSTCIVLCSDISYIGHYDGLLCDMLTYEGYYTS